MRADIKSVVMMAGRRHPDDKLTLRNEINVHISFLLQIMASYIFKDSETVS